MQLSRVSLNFAIFVLVIFGTGGCCLAGGQCSRVDSSPSVRWILENGSPVPLSEEHLNVTYVTNLAFGVRTFEAQWVVIDSVGLNRPIPAPERLVNITDAGELGNLLKDGDRRNNQLILDYEYRGATYTDTLFYDSYREETKCCTTSGIEPVSDVRGPLVVGFRTSRDFPGVIITLRDSL